jgi:hypothetical protein
MLEAVVLVVTWIAAAALFVAGWWQPQAQQDQRQSRRRCSGHVVVGRIPSLTGPLSERGQRVQTP